MINQLINFIEKYLNNEPVDTPEGYEDIHVDKEQTEGNYYFYYFLEDFIGSEKGELTTEVDDIVEHIFDIAIEMEPMLDTTDMDIRLREYYDRLKEITPFI